MCAHVCQPTEDHASCIWGSSLLSIQAHSKCVMVIRVPQNSLCFCCNKWMWLTKTFWYPEAGCQFIQLCANLPPLIMCGSALASPAYFLFFPPFFFNQGSGRRKKSNKDKKPGRKKCNPHLPAVWDVRASVGLMGFCGRSVAMDVEVVLVVSPGSSFAPNSN